ncbi:KAP family P-loop NTPase fold protein [Flavobacterium psychrotrophum]|uniref:KAP family P-loop NTPase fold protein n=1 Tax=Flavobacterium psychrotrophum TaxID=2294119 RepID=UPI0013C4C6F4|nr:P-loop NTPase fold protein [Flavobacterium psychrotrophum]
MRYYNLLTSVKSRLFRLLSELKYPLLFSLAALLFIDALTRIYLDYIANPILSKFTSSVFADGLFFGIAIYVIVSLITKFRKGYYVKGSHVVMCTIGLFFYVYFRFCTLTNLFRPFYSIDSLKYTDVFLFLLAHPILLKLFSFFKSKASVPLAGSAGSFSAVNPIKSKSEDVLGRASRAQRLSVEIRNYKASESLAVGVVGEWGSGKTSFFYMVKESIVEGNDRNIIIDFNPWLNISIDSIVEDFFKTLEKSLEGYSLNIARTVREYAHNVVGLHKNNFADALLKGSDLILDLSLIERFNLLNNLLKKLNRRVYIFIDDFDRLQPNEIFETLKLIRNTAGFDSFTYVVAYDRDYLVESLERYGIPKANTFSDKIFQIEVEILPATTEQIHGHVIKILTGAFPSSEREISAFFIERYKLLAKLGTLRNVTASLRNIRDVERFMNSFIPDYNAVVNEVLFQDYFILKLLKFKYYTAYSFLFSYKEDLLTLEDLNRAQGKTPKYILKRADSNEKSKNKNHYDIFTGSLLEFFLKSGRSYTESELNDVRALINNLLFDEQKGTLSIVYEANYS